MHAGTASTLTQVRANYWIPKGCLLVKEVIENCLICRKYLTEPTDQLSLLPSNRMNQTLGFSVCGLEFAGQIYINNFWGSGRDIVLFTRGVIIALCLELVADMMTDSFLLTFRRLLARKGNCKVTCRDYTKTFLMSKIESSPKPSAKMRPFMLNKRTRFLD
ncbi:integrase catalytic domain-containing protein [Trichonephila inaurata madagascariensis]|uniref:Integrase catalytic domain-containing protein n=1 Tax=Trichonephila inaurata madagascariensis TaxID=2747483 RepID=A0A8X7CHY6_9ARAC|nr:integrase catalytic domain-containing protein [Trichonephila inaurata madagascariensis]